MREKKLSNHQLAKSKANITNRVHNYVRNNITVSNYKNPLNLSNAIRDHPRSFVIADYFLVINSSVFKSAIITST